MSTRLTNIFLVTKPIVRDMPAQVESCARIAKALERIETVARVAPHDKEELEEEQDDWMKEWDVVLVSRVMVTSKADTDHRPEGTRRRTPRSHQTQSRCVGSRRREESARGGGRDAREVGR